jgi:RimJ/RimL family protein N-acetyltransferase
MREEDLPFLFQLYTDPSRCHLWMPCRRVFDEREFLEAWRSWVDSLLGTKFIVESGQRPVGLVLSYDHYLEHGFAKVGVMLQEDHVGHGGGLLATALLMDYLFRSLPVRKLYQEVCGFNAHLVRILRKLGFAEEGLLKRDRFWNGSYWDLHLFAIYRESWPGIRARALRFTSAGERTPAEPSRINGNHPKARESAENTVS